MSTRIEKQHVILCEGYDDRAFWQGWLLHLGCKDPSNGGRKQVHDAWGRPVTRGFYLFLASARIGILVQPCGGRKGVLRAAELYLKDQLHRPASLVVNFDSDVDLAGDARPDARAAIEKVGAELIPVIWESGDESLYPGVPSQQTLERLAAVAIRAAYPSRGPAVEEWLQAEPRAETLPKSYAYSYLAKWYAQYGANDFYQALWRDEAVAAKLRDELESTGALGAITALLNGF